MTVLAGGFSYAQEVPAETEGTFEAVDESSLILFPEETPSDEAGEEAVPQEPALPSSVGAGDLLRVLAVLAGVVGAIYLLVAFLKRLSPLAENREEQIGILATRHLKKDASLHLIEVGNQVFLVGAGTNNINMIAEISDGETLDKLRLEARQQGPAQAGGSFRNLLRQGLSGQAFKGISEESPRFLREQRDRLKQLRGEE